jgi:hypothetical protein
MLHLKPGGPLSFKVKPDIGAKKQKQYKQDNKNKPVSVDYTQNPKSTIKGRC